MTGVDADGMELIATFCTFFNETSNHYQIDGQDVAQKFPTVTTDRGL